MKTFTGFFLITTTIYILLISHGSALQKTVSFPAKDCIVWRLGRSWTSIPLSARLSTPTDSGNDISKMKSIPTKRSKIAHDKKSSSDRTVRAIEDKGHTVAARASSTPTETARKNKKQNSHNIELSDTDKSEFKRKRRTSSANSSDNAIDSSDIAIATGDEIMISQLSKSSATKSSSRSPSRPKTDLPKSNFDKRKGERETRNPEPLLQLKKDNERSVPAVKVDQEDKDAVEGIGYQVESFRSGFISIIGNPNAGKSTLMNALLNQSLSIVSPKPQTTRHRILGVVTEKDYQMIFSDTPGMLNRTAYKLQDAMMESVTAAAGDGDVLLVVTDVYGQELMNDNVMKRLELSDRPVVVVINKMDLFTRYNVSTKSNSSSVSVADYHPSYGVYEPSKGISVSQAQTTKKGTGALQKLLGKSRDPTVTDSAVNEEIKVEAIDQLENIEAINSDNDDLTESKERPRVLTKETLVKLWQNRLPKAEIIFLSAQSQMNINTLKEKLLKHLDMGPKYFPEDLVTNRDERFFTCEIIRETIFQNFNDELPYSCEVVVESFSDKTDNLSVIAANILVSRDSQKNIVIGKGGSKIKQVSMAARQKLERFLERKVYLSLNVKVDSNWRSNDESLRRYGYIDSDA